MKFGSLIFICLCCIAHTYSQNCGIKEKEQVNNIVLSKVWEQDTKGGVRDRFTSEDPKQADGEVCYYFDSNGNLRKFMLRWEYPESLSLIIAYYNEEGELMYIIFSDFQPEGYSYQGIAYKTYCGEFSDSITFNYNVQYKFLPDFENRNVQGNSNKYPSMIGEWKLSSYVHVDSLKSHLQIETIQPLPNSKKVKFYKPSKNQTTFINSHGINLIEGINTSSKVIINIDIGKKVKILDVLQEESVGNFGNYNWYKIEVNNISGYVFGGFLEPAEKEIKQ